MTGFCNDDEKPDGPDHWYDTPPKDVRLSVAPSHNGLFDPGNTIGAFNTFICIESVALQPFKSVTVTVYIPAFDRFGFVICGFWTDDVKPPGPSQTYSEPEVVESCNVAPSQIFLLLVLTTGGVHKNFVINPSSEPPP